MDENAATNGPGGKPQKQRRPNKLLRAAREGRGWSQRDVAEHIGAPGYVLINRWENGSARPSPHYVQRLCKLFQATPKELGLLPAVAERNATAFSLQLSFTPDQDVLVAHLAQLIGRER